jgi:DeoR/GlpR family transcriptional regulator of sugar metabolism
MVTRETAGLAAQRQERIRQTVRERGAVSVEDLHRELGVSAATVRRDLLDLDARGQVRRVHGGAVRAEGAVEEPVFDDKAAVAAAEKHRIAQAALRLVKPAEAVYLDGGSTVLALARLLTDRHGLTVVTNSLRVATTLSGAGPDLIVTGGELRRLSQTFVGPLTRPLLDQLRVDIAFVGTMGLSHAEGMTTTDAREALTKELAMSRARRVVLLAHSAKIGTVSLVRVGTIEQVDVLVTDGGADPKDVARFRRRGLKVVIA